MERGVRWNDWLYARRYQDSEEGKLGHVCLPPVEPKRPYSHGRRFIPAWLAADRELCMWSDDGMKAVDVWQFRWNSTVILDIDPTVMRMDGGDAMPNESMTRDV